MISMDSHVIISMVKVLIPDYVHHALSWDRISAPNTMEFQMLDIIDLPLDDGISPSFPS